MLYNIHDIVLVIFYPTFGAVTSSINRIEDFQRCLKTERQTQN